MHMSLKSGNRLCFGEIMREKVDKIRKYLDNQEENREKLLDVAHNAIRKSSSAMAAFHRGDEEVYENKIEKIKEDIKSLNKIIEKKPHFLSHGSLLAAHREFSEAVITKALIKGEEVPDPDELNVLYRSYAQALAETVGELRRHVLNLLREDELEEARRVHEEMEKIFDQLEQFDYPDSILSGMKHRRDGARKSLEKTRADITRAIRERRLENALKNVEEGLEE